MNTFEEYQSHAGRLPASVRNNHDRIEFPVTGLQEEAGKLGTLLMSAIESGKFSITEEQGKEVKDRLADILWYTALICEETGNSMQDVASHSVESLRARVKHLDSEQR